jgi:hypothetical protein
MKKGLEKGVKKGRKKGTLNDLTVMRQLFFFDVAQKTRRAQLIPNQLNEIIL